MGASLSVSGSFFYDGVPLQVVEPFFRDLDGSKEFLADRLIDVTFVRGQSPPQVGYSWIERRALRENNNSSGTNISIQKTLTHLSPEGTSPFQVRFTIDVVDGPWYIPRFHGTYSIRIEPEEREESCRVDYTNAFVPGSYFAFLPAILCRRHLKRILHDQTQQENQRQYEAALQTMKKKETSDVDLLLEDYTTERLDHSRY